MAEKLMAVRLPIPIHTRLEAMRAVLREMTGRHVTQGEAVGRALECLSDSHAGRAWLSGAEGAGRWRNATKNRLRRFVGPTAGACPPDLTLDGVGFNAATGQAHIAIRGEPLSPWQQPVL